MQVQIEVPFEELVKIVKNLPKPQLSKLKAVIDEQTKEDNGNEALLQLLLNGPVATSKQIETIVNNRNAINQWRTK